MDDPPAQPDEALFFVISSLVRSLAQAGIVQRGTFEIMRDAFTMQADGTINPQKRADCRLAAEYAEVLAIVTEPTPPDPAEPTHPHLRVVRDDDK